MSVSYEKLPEDVKLRSSQQLQKVLYCSIDLYMQIKESHWIMYGREFLSVHRLFDEVAEIVEDTIDDVAERIAQLGCKPEGTLQSVASKSTLPPYPNTLSSIDAHVELISKHLAFVTGMALQAMAEMGETDPISVDLLTTRTRELDMQTWLVEAHLPRKH